MGVPTYPARPRFFSHTFCRTMAKVCLANDLGHGVCWMLTVIVQTEDAAHYRRAVTFHNEQLAILCGMTPKQLRTAREKATRAGWLHYLPGRKRMPAAYWVTVPDHAADLDDMPTDEGDFPTVVTTGLPGHDSCPMPAQCLPESTPETGTNRARNGHAMGEQWASVGHTFIPVPDPDPEEYSAPPTGCPADGLTESDPPPSVRVFVDAWNAAGLIPRSAGSDLRARWQKAWREFAGFRDRWRQAVEHAGKQARCRPGGEFPLSPEFLLGKESAVERVLAGEFDDRAAPARSPPGPPRGRSSADVAARAKARVEDMRRRQAADAG